MSKTIEEFNRYVNEHIKTNLTSEVPVTEKKLQQVIGELGYAIATALESLEKK